MLMNGTKIHHSTFASLETIKLRHILFPRSPWSLRFNSSDNHRWWSSATMELLLCKWVRVM